MPPSPTPTDQLDAKIAALRDVIRGTSRWSDRKAYSVAGREFAHLHGPDEVDIRLTARLQSRHKGRLRGDERVGLRQNRSEWITFTLRSTEDVRDALEWIRMARDANRAETG
ncbi:MAG: luciferase family protein [Thermoplasmata archaeon]